jgi:hypothetical protein
MSKFITAKSRQPFTIVRDLVIVDEQGKFKCLEAVKITIEKAHFDAETVAEEGFAGDWCVHLSDDPRFAGLTDGEKESAEEECFHHLEELAVDLSQGEKIEKVIS